jgi:hypothetical protein
MARVDSRASRARSCHAGALGTSRWDISHLVHQRGAFQRREVRRIRARVHASRAGFAAFLSRDDDRPQERDSEAFHPAVAPRPRRAQGAPGVRRRGETNGAKLRQRREPHRGRGYPRPARIPTTALVAETMASMSSMTSMGEGLIPQRRGRGCAGRAFYRGLVRISLTYFLNGLSLRARLC